MSDKKTSKDAERDLLAPVSFDEFKKPTYEQWQAEVEKGLKGGDFHKKMFTKIFNKLWICIFFFLKSLYIVFTPSVES